MCTGRTRHAHPLEKPAGVCAEEDSSGATHEAARDAWLYLTIASPRCCMAATSLQSLTAWHFPDWLQYWNTAAEELPALMRDRHGAPHGFSVPRGAQRGGQRAAAVHAQRVLDHWLGAEASSVCSSNRADGIHKVQHCNALCWAGLPYAVQACCAQR